MRFVSRQFYVTFCRILNETFFQTGHHRLKRSVHNAAVEEVSKRSVVKHDDGVAANPSLMTTKDSTAIDSHLQDKPTGTDSKCHYISAKYSTVSLAFEYRAFSFEMFDETRNTKQQCFYF